MTLFNCDNPLNIASTPYVDCVVTTVSGHLQEQIDSNFRGIIHMDFTPVVVSGTTSRTNVVSYNIPANTVVGNHPLRVTSTYEVYQGSGSSPQYLDFRASFDSTDVMFTQPHAEFGNHFGRVVNTIYPKNSTSQKLISEGVCAGWSDDQVTEDSTGSWVHDVRDSVADMTADVLYELDLQLSVAHSGFFVIRTGVIIEVI